MKQRLFAIKQKMLQFLLPIVSILHGQLVLKIIDKGPLVLLVPQEVPPIFVNQLGRRRLPGNQVFDLVIVNVMQLVFIGTKQVGRAEDMYIVVVKMEVVPQYGIIHMVCLQ